MIGVILSLMLLCQSGTAGVPEAEVWLLQNGTRLPVPFASVAEVNTRGLNNFIYTRGYTNLDMDVFFAGPEATLRISDRKPVFIAQTDRGFEPILIRLETRRDRRICRTQPSSASIDNKQGFRRQDIVRTVLTVNSDKSFTVQPERPLPPGEYLLVTGSPHLGRDFGID